MKPSDIALAAVNSVLFVGTILAVGVGVLWWRSPNVVDEWGKRLTTEYVDGWQTRLREARAAARGRRGTEGAAALETLVDDLSDIKPGDRLASTKRQALAALVSHYELSRQHDRALVWVDAWIAFDDRDLHAQATRARVLRRIPGRESEGQDAIVQLYARFPEARSVAAEYAKVKRQRTRQGGPR
jgi:hypothetical protein